MSNKLGDVYDEHGHKVGELHGGDDGCMDMALLLLGGVVLLILGIGFLVTRAINVVQYGNPDPTGAAYQATNTAYQATVTAYTNVQHAIRVSSIIGNPPVYGLNTSTAHLNCTLVFSNASANTIRFYWLAEWSGGISDDGGLDLYGDRAISTHVAVTLRPSGSVKIGLASLMTMKPHPGDGVDSYAYRIDSIQVQPVTGTHEVFRLPVQDNTLLSAALLPLDQSQPPCLVGGL